MPHKQQKLHAFFKTVSRTSLPFISCFAFNFSFHKKNSSAMTYFLEFSSAVYLLTKIRLIMNNLLFGYILKGTIFCLHIAFVDTCLSLHKFKLFWQQPIQPQFDGLTGSMTFPKLKALSHQGGKCWRTWEYCMPESMPEYASHTPDYDRLWQSTPEYARVC